MLVEINYYVHGPGDHENHERVAVNPDDISSIERDGSNCVIRMKTGTSYIPTDHYGPILKLFREAEDGKKESIT